MDIISSQANLAGYKAVLDPCIFSKAIPMMTAAERSRCESISYWSRCSWSKLLHCQKMGQLVCDRCENASKEQVESLVENF